MNTSQVKRIIYVYMATNLYRRHFKGFLETFPRFIPGIQKELVVYTDNPSELKEVWESWHKDHQDCKIRIHFITIQHLPWPINALMKFKYVNDALLAFTPHELQQETLCFYGDSKIEFTDDIFLNIYKDDKITTVYHNQYPYPSDYVKGQMWVANRGTNADFDGDYEYHQSGFFGGDFDDMSRLCTTCNEWVENDLVNHRLPCVDDESYLNKYIALHLDEIYTLPKGMWGCKGDPDCRYQSAEINIRDHSDAVWEREKIKYGIHE